MEASTEETDGGEMKDNDIKIRFDELWGHMENLKRRVADSGLDVDIKDCPKCKHPVVVQTLPYTYGATYRCLTCGVKFFCINKEVSEVLDE